MSFNSNGDIIHNTVQVVDPGDMHISGRIDDHSFVFLVSTGGSIIVDGKIDGNSQVILVSTTGSITVGGKIDGNSQATLRAAGNVTIGTQGGEGDKKIDGDSNVEIVAGGKISLGSYVHKATADFSAHGGISVTEIDYGATVRQLADGDISVSGKIDGASRVELVSNRGSVKINGKIDGNSKVSLTAGQDIGIGIDSHLGDDDRKIDGNSFVAATAGGSITLGGGIFKDHTAVDFAAAGKIQISKSISAGANARLLSAAGQITVTDGITDHGTVTSFPPGALTTNVDNARLTETEWAAPDTLPKNVPGNGHWWENWPQTFGYVAPFRVLPRSVGDIATAIINAVQVKAVGGGWSFSDAALPLKTKAEVDQISIQLRGAAQRQDMRNVLEGINDQYPERMDLLPQAVARNVAFSTAFDQQKLRQVTISGAQLPAFGRVCLIDTRSLASSLHCEFSGIRATAEQKQPENLFHVEAGITMADLQQLLDHQNPRLALLASGGSPGATLAGALSTATHGGEFRWPLLVDTVRAVHLVCPGGEQWWIEGDVPVANQVKLQNRYPQIDQAHFIGAGWNGISGLTAQDVLKAVIVSMGTLGVIYSIVLAVVPQFGLRQVVHPTSWKELLAAAKTNEKELRVGNVTANKAVLAVLTDGALNGTGIAQADNVYVDLAINPFNRDCWVVNRQVTPSLPDDANIPSPGIGDYMTALSRALASRAVDTAFSSKFVGRIFDFLSYATDVPINLDDLSNDVDQAGRLLTFIARLGDILGGTLASTSAQTVVNFVNASNLDRGLQFLGDALTGFFHALEGTAPGINSDRTGVSYKVGAIGWPDGGLPGRGLEIALDSTNAFTFLQAVVFDDILANAMSNRPIKPLIGYISIRLCPPTQTLMGMQQYSPFSVMTEVVAYRSPEANEVMDDIQKKALAFSTAGPKPLLHWGLENDQVTNAYLVSTPLGQPYKGTTRLEAFKKIRQFLRKGHTPVFDNNFSSRMGL
jgi:hypothetical protein